MRHLCMIEYLDTLCEPNELMKMGINIDSIFSIRKSYETFNDSELYSIDFMERVNGPQRLLITPDSARRLLGCTF